MSSVEVKIKELISPIAEDMGLKVRKVEWKKERKKNFLIIFIDRQGGVNLNDCAKFSNEISVLIDEENVIKERYYLEVSSPGLNREISIPDEFPELTGKKLKIVLKKPAEGLKTIVGTLKSYREESVVLANEKQNRLWQVSVKNIEKANLEPDF